MDEWTLRMPWGGAESLPDAGGTAPLSDQLLNREWLVTNGLGGYASGTLAGVATRRYHSLLIAALPSSLGRQVMLNHVMELVRLPDGQTSFIGGEELTGGDLKLHGTQYLKEFRLERGLPVWRYELNGARIEKSILLPHRQNTVHITYRLLSGAASVRLKVRPSLHFRGHDAPVGQPHQGPYTLTMINNRYEIKPKSDLPPLRLQAYGEEPAFTIDGKEQTNVLYRLERDRGYDSLGGLWSPGYFRMTLRPDAPATVVASTENWETILALTPDQAYQAELERRHRLLNMARPQVRSGPAGDLVLAADQFIITPVGRTADAARAHAAGEEVCSVIAGYHWFTDWGRDTMISLEGLTLTTGRHVEASYILHTFGHYIRDGLLPNLFPEGEQQGLYHTADATLWFFHAIHRYTQATGDRTTLQHLLPRLIDIFEHHRRGTRFNIRMDPADGLLSQGEEGYQLTWMDAKVGDWVVTPRRGKAVEINALWYNALRLLEGWVNEEHGEGHARDITAVADQARESFNRRYWYQDGGYLYDVIDGENGDDSSCRPNQLLAFSLEHPVLDRERWGVVLSVCQERLLTPVGLRSLAPGSPDYKPRYDGDLRARDAAYHQGTVWAWLIGPYVDAWLRVHPEDTAGARRLLEGFVAHLSEACIGSISEVFDAEAPYTPRGCIAQAWSVAEVLRSWAKING